MRSVFESIFCSLIENIGRFVNTDQTTRHCILPLFILFQSGEMSVTANFVKNSIAVIDIARSKILGV